MYKHIAVVTGCAGFIGTTLTKLLLEKGWLVYGIDKFTYVANETEMQCTTKYIIQTTMYCNKK